MKTTYALFLAATIWLGIGIMLLMKGLNIANGLFDQQQVTVLAKVINCINMQNFVYGLISVGIAIGFLKGNMVFRKLALKNVQRLKTKNRVAPWDIYPRSTWMIIMVMMGIGMLLKQFPMISDIRAAILIGVGSALIQGGIFYLRFIFQPYNQEI